MRLQPPAAARARVTAVTAVLVTAMQAVVPRAVMAASVQTVAIAVAALATAQHTKTVAPVWVIPPSAPSAMPWNMRSRP